MSLVVVKVLRVFKGGSSSGSELSLPLGVMVLSDSLDDVASLGCSGRLVGLGWSGGLCFGGLGGVGFLNVSTVSVAPVSVVSIAV